MRIARALRWRGLTAGVLALACAAPALADEPDRAEAAPGAATPERPPRPPLPPEPTPVRLPWENHVEVGGDVALAHRLGSADAGGRATKVRLRPALGYSLHARWVLFRYLRVSAYFVGAEHELELLPGALGLPGSITPAPVESLVFGGRLSPTLPLGTRTRLSLSIGVGYEHFDFGRMEVDDTASGPFRVHARGASYVEIPVGLGVSVDLIRRWLTLDLETSGAFVLGSGGDATRPAQAVDGQGRLRTVGGLPQVDGSFVQTVGLSLVL
jgi:hypothetical protein